MFEHIPGIEQFYLSLVQLAHFYAVTLTALQIPVPIGLLGTWRWGVWLLRRFIGLFYRPQPVTGFSTTTSVVTPVYNEVPHVFQAALRSWAANRPTEIIAVIDHSDERSIQIFREFSEECLANGISPKLIVTSKPGKRPALADGIVASSCEVVCLVDSDTIWAEDVLVHGLAPFEDPRVGGVTTRQNVLNPASVAQRIFDVYLDIRYEDEVRFLTAFVDTPFGDAITCLSGRTAIYRHAAVFPVVDDLMNETFLGKPVISGDDKALTLLVQGQYWKIRYQSTAKVFTPGAAEMRVFLKQRLRWARNSWRADLKALLSRWAWRKPLLAFHLIDRLLQPLTTIVAPLYLSFAIFRQHWIAVFIVTTWWFISRSIKLWPHLRRDWTNITILPFYVGFNYWSAVMRIYAFFTMNQQGWITRWSKNRMAMLGPLRALPAYLGTMVTVSLVAMLVFFRGLTAETSAKELLPDPPMMVISTGSSGMVEGQIQPSMNTLDTFKLSGNLLQGNIKSAQWQPIFSPDGRQIVFVSEQLGVLQLFVRDPSSGRLRQLVSNIIPKSMPVWSPDSRKIAFLVGENEMTAVQTVDVYTDETRTWWPAYQQGVLKDFIWSRDSQSIVMNFSNSNVAQTQSAPAAEVLAQPTALNNQPDAPVRFITQNASTVLSTSQLVIEHANVQIVTVVPQASMPVTSTSTATSVPTLAATSTATLTPTKLPTQSPTSLPTNTSTATLAPTELPTQSPTPLPTHTPTATTPPTHSPTALPTHTSTRTPLPTARPTDTATPPPTVTPFSSQVLAVPTFEGTPRFYLIAIIPTDHPVNARYRADTASPILMLLTPESTLSAIGRTKDSDWLQVILPDQRLAWVAANTVRVDWNYVNNLPVVAGQ